MNRLPIDDVLPELIGALSVQNRAVLQAPPGAGKTTRVPLVILKAGLCPGKIVMLEPRRLAAKGAAERMAETLDEQVGQTIGYRMRGDSRSSKDTKIEVVTEGILTRMLQSDPELKGISCLIFDEFHERSLNADLGLALAWEVATALREDLKILVMSATLDAEPVARLLGDAPVITSDGQSFPVDIHWLSKPSTKSARLEPIVADQIISALKGTVGNVLVFLPGEGEIRRVQSQLNNLPNDVQVYPLYGAMPFPEQRKAILPVKSGRKVVLATAIAETSLTIEGIHVVIDAGLSRRARYDPNRGMSRLVTERVTKAEAKQRSGRAGRLAPGICYRMWTKGEEGALFEFPPPEIATADLAGFALELAVWGARTAELALLDQPPAGTWREAIALLTSLGALDQNGRITEHGRAMAKLPIHPRLAQMMLKAGKQAATMAALLNERDPLRDVGCDLEIRLDALANPKKYPAAKNAITRIKSEANRLSNLAPIGTARTPAEQAALAYPDRIGLRRNGNEPRWILSGGSGAKMDASDSLAGARLLVVTDTDGAGRDPKIRQAIALSEAELRNVYGPQIEWLDVCEWSRRDKSVQTRRKECFGAITLDERNWTAPPADMIALAALEGVRELGIPWTEKTKRFRSRVELLRSQGLELADCSETTLMQELDAWLLPFANGIRTAADIKALDILPALKARLGWQGEDLLNRMAPGHFTTPLSRSIPIDYGSGTPEISVCLQEMFGVTEHPSVGNAPIKVTLLSPAGRPVQVTMDLPGFWASSYNDVRKDMRGRYPKHPWPEDPTIADPTLRAKPRR